MATYVLAAPVVDQAAGRILAACGLLLAAVVVLCVGVWYYRRWWLGDRETLGPTGWTFADLRRMRDQGELSEEEYQSLRAALLGSHGVKAPAGPADQRAGSDQRNDREPSDFDL